MNQTRRRDNPMTKLYQRLAGVGFNRPFVKNIVLPDWWEDEIAETPAGYSQGLGLVARHLGLDVRTLYADAGDLAYFDVGPKRFKKGLNVSEEDLALAVCLAMRVADFACHAAPAPTVPLAQSAAQLRTTLLEQHPACVDFGSLLDYCWKCGIPVIHIAEFPAGTKKMDGLVVRINGRPVIVLTKTSKFSSWLLFILAHEMGHIIRDVLRDDKGCDYYVDENVTGDGDAEEREVNKFAVELLTGQPDSEYTASSNLTGKQLAASAARAGEAQQVDPGVVALNYARVKGHWGAAMNALNLLEPEADALALVRVKMRERLDWERLPEESQEFLRRITGVTTAE